MICHCVCELRHLGAVMREAACCFVAVHENVHEVPADSLTPQGSLLGAGMSPPSLQRGEVERSAGTAVSRKLEGLLWT